MQVSSDLPIESDTKTDVGKEEVEPYSIYPNETDNDPIPQQKERRDSPKPIERPALFSDKYRMAEDGKQQH